MLKLRAAPAAKNVLDAIEVLCGMNRDHARKVPADAPTEKERRLQIDAMRFRLDDGIA